MYRPIWSSAILDELRFHEAAKLQRRGVPEDDARSRAEYLIGQMREAFDDAEIQGWEGLEGSYGLPDPDDEHVVAAAVVGGAGAIVTANFKDFPAERLPPGLRALSAAEFALDTVALDPARGVRAVQQIVERSGRKGPPRTVDDVLDTLVRRYDLIDAVDLVRKALDRNAR
jgi:hypothetical protein